MHGGRNRRDGTNIAGNTIVIANNTFLSPARAIAFGGVPKNRAKITRNLFFQAKMGPKTFTLVPPTDDPLPENILIFDNLFNSKGTLELNSNRKNK